MRLIWNDNEKRFEAQFAQGDQWRADQAAAVDAGFKTDGAPAWIWYVYKPAALAELRDHRPDSGLTITKEALDAFNHLQAVEQKDAELKKFAKEQKKLQKRETERRQLNALHGEDEQIEPEYKPRHYRTVPDYWKGKTEITVADLDPDTLARLSKREPISLRKAEPIGKCKICGDPTYDPEEIDLCLWDSGRGEEKFFEELFA